MVKFGITSYSVSNVVEYTVAQIQVMLVKAKIYEKIMPIPESGCKIWMGCVSNGYGSMTYKGKHIRPHRLLWILERGDIPEGLHVCHKCDVPLCINLNHLFLGTREENMKDMVNKNRQARGTEKITSVLTGEQVRMIRNSPKSSRELAIELGVSANTVHRAKTKRSYREIQ